MKHFLLVLFSVVLFSCGDKESDPSPSLKATGKTISYRVENRSTTGTILDVLITYTDKDKDGKTIYTEIEKKSLSKGVYNKSVLVDLDHQYIKISVQRDPAKTDTVKYYVDYSFTSDTQRKMTNANGIDISIDTKIVD